MSGPTWTYTPEHHKTEHHGRERKIFLGPKAQVVLGTFLRHDLSAYLFSPKEAEAERRARKSASRSTPLNSGNRPGTNRTNRRPFNDHYTPTNYRVAIGRGCDLAFPLPRHLAAGRVPSERGTRKETTEETRGRLGPTLANAYVADQRLPYVLTTQCKSCQFKAGPKERAAGHKSGFHALTCPQSSYHL